MTDTQLGLLGGETPLAELDLGPVQRRLAQRERELAGGDPLTADEAGAIVHAYRGKHSEDTRCRYCAIDGADALGRLHARLPLEERSPVSVPRRGRSSSRRPLGEPEVSMGPSGESDAATPAATRKGAAASGSPSENRAGYAHAGAGDTEAAAAARVYPTSGTAHARVLEAIAASGIHGKTDEELSLELALRLYTAAPRRKELLDAGWIMDSGQRRPTTTGCMATVWTLTPEARRDPRVAEPEPEL